MVSRGLSRSKKRQRKSPSGKPSIKYKPKKAGQAKCALCKAKLHAVPRASTVQLQKIPKTKKRPERKFGGVLCANCTAKIIKEKTRLEDKTVKRTGLDLRLIKYTDSLKKATEKKGS
ncbi:MAG: 50S ribosomal protein L34e [Candidatus Micrarchaeia archaeon]